jgi:PAS domain S-box-containing protein
MEMINLEQDFSSEFNRIRAKVDLIKREWENFISTGNLLSDNVISVEVWSSWVRCRNRGLNPFNVPNVSLSSDELAQRMQKNSWLIEIATPFLHTIADNMEGSGFRVDLFDEDLYLLWHSGDRRVLEESEKRSLIRPGINRNEATSGTNAINLAALLEKPIQLIGPEHYNAALQHWTCSAVPIKDERGKIIAVINAAGYYWLMHKHTLGMMTALGKSIEYCLMQKAVRKELEKSIRFNKEIIESIADAVIVVNYDGRIIMANRAANQTFGINGSDITGHTADSIWEYNNPFSEVLNTEQPIVDREIPFSRQGRTIRLIGTIRPISLEEKGLQGVIGTFKGLHDTRGMIKHYVGWKAHFKFNNLIGEDCEFRQAVRLAKETAKMYSNILIQGESGTGKELFAQAIHNDSNYCDGPFVVINCAAIPNGLLESELFGYEGGAFTGAKKGGQPGKFELAEGGTIFLDEINSLPLDMQAKILRTLQTKTVIRVGGAEEIPVKVRVIAASNTDLWQMVQRGEFREDLFYRINVITIKIPPLRRRGNDLSLLINHIMSTKGIVPCLEIEEAGVELLKKYDWPGNIRELENFLERSYVMAKTKGSNKVTVDDLLGQPEVCRALGKPDGGQVPAMQSSRGAFELKILEKDAIVSALTGSNGNISIAAQSLGIARNTLYRKIKRYGIIYNC